VELVSDLVAPFDRMTPAEATALLEEHFGVAAAGLERLDTETELGPWLYRTTANLALNRLRDEKSRPVAQRLIAGVLDGLLRLLSPFIPFVCEEIWERLGAIAPERGLPNPSQPAPVCMTAPWTELPAEWRDATLAICKALGSEPSELFPEHLDHEIPTNRIASFVERAQITGGAALQLGPGEECQQVEMEQTLDEVLGTLTDRERNVLKARFWEGKTLDEIGDEQGVRGNTIRMVEAKALRKLRHPTRLEKLEGVCAFA
jgi:RNA polymerase sigma factor (sigma-70 family)